MNVRIDRATVQRLMAEKKLTGTDLAERMSLSKQALSAALCRGTFSHLNAFKLANALGVDYEDVLAKEAARDGGVL